jgi:hypothetical protein
VQLIQEEPRVSEWKLATEAFGRQWEFAWTATNLTVRHLTCTAPPQTSHPWSLPPSVFPWCDHNVCAIENHVQLRIPGCRARCATAHQISEDPLDG